jgi:hypothetical protein
MSISPEIPMSRSRYSNGCVENESTFPIMGVLPNNPSGNTFVAHTKAQFEDFVVRSTNPVIAYFFCSDNAEQTAIVGQLAQTVQGSSNHVVIVDCKEVPEVANTYGWPNRPLPIIARLYRTHVLRFMEYPFTFERLCLFTNSTKQWRNKGFYPQTSTS